MVELHKLPRPVVGAETSPQAPKTRRQRGDELQQLLGTTFRALGRA